jgi:hypothetical protein
MEAQTQGFAPSLFPARSLQTMNLTKPPPPGFALKAVFSLTVLPFSQSQPPLCHRCSPLLSGILRKGLETVAQGQKPAKWFCSEGYQFRGCIFLSTFPLCEGGIVFIIMRVKIKNRKNSNTDWQGCDIATQGLRTTDQALSCAEYTMRQAVWPEITAQI